MLFNEQSFIFIFLPVVLAGLFAFKAWAPRLTCVWVVVSSFFFYGFHAWEHLPLLAGSVILNYWLGSRIQKSEKPKTTFNLLALGIFGNLGVLAVFKYADFFLLQLGYDEGFGLLLPLAISFFTFQQIAYLVDLGRGKITNPGFLHYCVFVSFFPQLIAGPIVRCQKIIPQLKKGMLGKLSSEAFWTGLCLFSIGLFKKACLADGIRPLAESIFTASSQGTILSTAEAWVGATAFGLQIYFDFSAYSDMALGLGLFFGLRLPLNFNSPYKAVSIVDFWRRWHITLSEFLRDYLYKPLGGNRHGVSRGIINAMVVMALGGLWHGASWTFVIWGLMHGVFIGANHLFRLWKPKSDEKVSSSSLGLYVRRLTTFFFVTIAWVFFRNQEFDSALSMLESMLGLNGIDLPRSLLFETHGTFLRFGGLFANQFMDITQLPFFFFLLGLVWFAPNALELLKVSRIEEFAHRPPPRTLLFLCGALLFWGIKVSFESTTHEFLYFRF
jgi:alginate O-acetyltransferase complex protein AlgI